MAAKDVGKIFIKKDVQEILRRITELDVNKVFAPRYNRGLRKPKIQFLTDKNLKHYQDEYLKKAKYYLQMPPFLKPREQCQTPIINDEKLNMFTTQNTKYMFIDISLDKANSERQIVVREPNGLLRNASWQEREKMLQVYYPIKGKLSRIPKMFESENLENCLKNKMYILVLEKACFQFEPNDAEFIRITHRVYECIDQNSAYEVLKSTRFYGPQIFYLVWYKKLQNILAYLLKNKNIDECFDILNLYYIVHPESASKDEFKKKLAESNKYLEVIKFFATSELKESAKVELALQNLRQDNL